MPGAVLEFSIPGEPVPWARAGKATRIKGGRIIHQQYTPHAQRCHMDVIRIWARKALMGRARLKGALALEATFTFPWPVGTPLKTRKLGRIYKATKPDGSNLIKIIEDALNGLAFEDDARIADGRFAKFYGDQVGTSVRITEIGGVACDLPLFQPRLVPELAA